ncbi:MAG: M20/M25/M40 family metallo-hydrolase [Elusimicrobia bacterium]|nr:M20/M25/M40 family metallo-hydrolase [Elusimicrobiota bacterium]
MSKHVLAAGFCLFALSSYAAEGPGFDQGVSIPAIGLKTSAHPQDGPSTWISVATEDVVSLKAAGFLMSAPLAQSGRAAIYQVSEASLPQISRHMHERFHRCGGFFAHRTLDDAKRDLSDPPEGAAPAGPFTVDQGAWLSPVLPNVKEAGIRSTIETLAAFQNRYYQSSAGVDAARWIGARWQELAANLPGATVRYVAHSGWKQPSVILTIPGTESPDEFVVLGGHLDSINLSGWGDENVRAPGADDNASGIATITEALRVLAQAGFKPKRTVQFMGYAAEEIGLRGSQEIAASYSGKKVVGVIQYDMTNLNSSGDNVYLLGDYTDASLTAFLGKLVDAYSGTRSIGIRCGYACSDHASWHRAGFPASAAFESQKGSMNQHIHTEDDTLANAGGDSRHAVPFAKLAVAFAVELAKTSQAPRLDGSLTKR